VTFYLSDDRSFGKGKKITNDDDIYDLNGFQIRFFTKQQGDYMMALVKGEVSL